MTRGLGWGLLAAAGWLVGGCAADDGAEAREHAELWQARGPASYVYVLNRSCQSCSPAPLRIVVEDGAVASADEVPTGLFVESGAVTMTQLLEQLVTAAGHDNEEFSATFDESLGYVRRASIDHSTDIDDEWAVEVTCFSADVGEDACALPTVDELACTGETTSAHAEPVSASGVRPCLGGSPIGRISGADLVCCSGLAGRECSELAAEMETQVRALQACSTDADCEWKSVVRGCHVPLHVGVSLDTPNLIIAAAEEQGCPIDDSASFCEPAVLDQVSFCDAGRCTLK